LFHFISFLDGVERQIGHGAAGFFSLGFWVEVQCMYLFKYSYRPNKFSQT